MKLIKDFGEVLEEAGYLETKQTRLELIKDMEFPKAGKGVSYGDFVNSTGKLIEKKKGKNDT